MRRIGLAVIVIAGLTLAPLTGEAQQTERVYQVGVLSLGASGTPGPWWQPFFDELRELNYVRGRNLVIHYSGADAKVDRLPGLVADLVKAKVDVIVTTGPRETLAAKRETSSIPIFFTIVPDPVGQRIVTNLARPDSNVTGLTTIVPGFYQKYVELLREIVPSATRFALLGSPISSPEPRQDVVDAGRTARVNIVFVPVSGPDEFDAALARSNESSRRWLPSWSD